MELSTYDIGSWLVRRLTDSYNIEGVVEGSTKKFAVGGGSYSQGRQIMGAE